MTTEIKENETIPPFTILRPHPIQRDCCGDFNGYISLPLGHCWYGKKYDELNEWGFSEGGLTYSELEKDRWVIGFDTGHIGGHLLDKEKVTEKAERLLENAADAERWEREQERIRLADLECHEKREEGRHWYQPYPEAVPLDLWEVARAKTAQTNRDHPHRNEFTVVDTVKYLSQATDKLDAYRLYSNEDRSWLTIGIRYGMAVDEYICVYITREVADQFNLDPLKRDN